MTTARPENIRSAKLEATTNCHSRVGASTDETIPHTVSRSPAPRRLNVRPAGQALTPKVPAQDGANSGQATIRTSPKITSPDRSDVPQQQAPLRPDTQTCNGLLLWDPVLATLAIAVDEIEAVRIAQTNRYRILTTAVEDSDGEVRGWGLAESHPAVASVATQLQTLEFLEKQAVKALNTQLRAHPMHPWIKAQKGLGDKTVARLLASIGDPYWNALHDRPRTVGELFAYCGVAGPGQRRARGQKAAWNAAARKRLWIITGPIIRGDGPYRAVYDAGRERYAEKVHTAPCNQCGKKGQPAEIGTPWRDGHKHAGAIRLVMREILRDLWTEARAIYTTTETS